MAQPDPNVLTIDVVATLPDSQCPSLAALADAMDAIKTVPAGMAAP